MAMDPEMKAVLATLASAPQVDVHALPPHEAAAQLRMVRLVPPSPDPSLTTEDRLIIGPGGAIPVRIYRPAEGRATGLLVSSHGGGWVMGSIASDDVRCRALARASGAMVVSVGYRLAPEHPFPAALDDCCAVLRWVWRERETLAWPGAPVAIGGSSAGANLAAAVALAERESVPLALQLLVCPVCDDDFDTPSYRDFAEGFHLTRDRMRWFWDQYAPDPARASALAAPLKAHDLAGAPPAHLVLAECDPLRDEGLAYAERLRAAGVPTTAIIYRGAIHAFTTLAPASAVARRAFEDIGAALRHAFEAG